MARGRRGRHRGADQRAGGVGIPLPARPDAEPDLDGRPVVVHRPAHRQQHRRLRSRAAPAGAWRRRRRRRPARHTAHGAGNRRRQPDYRGPVPADHVGGPRPVGQIDRDPGAVVPRAVGGLIAGGRRPGARARRSSGRTGRAPPRRAAAGVTQCHRRTGGTGSGAHSVRRDGGERPAPAVGTARRDHFRGAADRTHRGAVRDLEHRGGGCGQRRRGAVRDPLRQRHQFGQGPWRGGGPSGAGGARLGRGGNGDVRHRPGGRIHYGRIGRSGRAPGGAYRGTRPQRRRGGGQEGQGLRIAAPGRRSAVRQRRRR